MTQYCTDTTNSCTPTTIYTSSSPLVLSTLGTHYVRYGSTDNAPEGNAETTKSTQLTIAKEQPPDGDTQAPILSNLQPTGVLSAGTTQATLSVTTNEQGRCGYSTTPEVLNDPTAIELTESNNGISHSTLLSGLTNGTRYTYYVQCVDKAGNITPDFLIDFSIAETPAAGGGNPLRTILMIVVAVLLGILAWRLIRRFRG